MIMNLDGAVKIKDDFTLIMKIGNISTVISDNAQIDRLLEYINDFSINMLQDTTGSDPEIILMERLNSDLYIRFEIFNNSEDKI